MIVKFETALLEAMFCRVSESLNGLSRNRGTSFNADTKTWFCPNEVCSFDSIVFYNTSRGLNRNITSLTIARTSQCLRKIIPLAVSI